MSSNIKIFRPDWESIYEKTFDEKFGDPEISSDKRAKYLLDELIKSKDNTEKEYFTVPTEQTDLPAFLKSEERTEVKNLKVEKFLKLLLNSAFS